MAPALAVTAVVRVNASGKDASRPLDPIWVRPVSWATEGWTDCDTEAVVGSTT